MPTAVLRKTYGRLFLLTVCGFLAGSLLVTFGVLTRDVFATSPIVTRSAVWIGVLVSLLCFPLLFVTGFWYVKARRGTLNYDDINK